jgi:hypothetical protein
VPGHRLHAFRHACVGYRAGPAACFASAATAAAAVAGAASSSGAAQPAPSDERRLRRRRLGNNRTAAADAPSPQPQPRQQHRGGPGGIKSVVGRGRARQPREAHELFDAASAEEARSATGGGRGGFNRRKVGGSEGDKGGGYVRAHDRDEAGRRGPVAAQAAVRAAIQAAVAAGSDLGPRPHDGRGCFQCAARVQQVLMGISAFGSRSYSVSKIYLEPAKIAALLASVFLLSLTLPPSLIFFRFGAIHDPAARAGGHHLYERGLPRPRL